MIRPTPRSVSTADHAPRGAGRAAERRPERSVTMSGRDQVEGIVGQLEELWAHFDTLYDAVEAAGDWRHRHGPDWTFADLPYHMAYFDDQLVARALELGPDYPPAEP